MNKKCTKCNESLAKDNHSYCDSCYREYKKDWDNGNKEHIREYNKSWREDNKEYIKQYREGKKSYYLYVVMNDDKVEYVGATEILQERINNHLNGYSNIKELINSDRWTNIKYLDISNIVDNREEMLLLENALIDLYDTDWNKNKNIIKTVDKLREFTLLAEVHSLTQKWEVYCKNEHKKMLY